MTDEIKELMAWITVDEHGFEKIAMVHTTSIVVPLVGTGEKWLASSRILAAQLTQYSAVRLKKFKGGRTIETLRKKE